jgi:hypothetical protein
MLITIASMFLAVALLTSFLSSYYSLPCVVEKEGRRIILSESTDSLRRVAKWRLMFLVGYFFDVLLVLLLIYLIMSGPQSFMGSFQGTLKENGTIAGNMTVSQRFSQTQIVYGFLFFIYGGFFFFLLQKFFERKGRTYEHIYEKLLPEMNNRLCGGNICLDVMIKENRHKIVVENDNEAIKDILRVMKKRLYPQL